MGEQNAGYPGEDAADDKGADLVPADIDAERSGKFFVLPDGAQRAAIGRIDDRPACHRRRRHESHHHQIVTRQVAHIGAEQGDRTDQVEAGRGARIVAAIGEHDGQQLSEGERHDDEMMAADP